MFNPSEILLALNVMVFCTLLFVPSFMLLLIIFLKYDIKEQFKTTQKREGAFYDWF